MYKSQGDVNFVPVDKLPKRARKRTHWDGVIVRGEKTGHHHSVLEVAECERYDLGEEMFLVVSERGISNVHQEHDTVSLEPGVWKIHQDQAFDYSSRAIRKVAD